MPKEEQRNTDHQRESVSNLMVALGTLRAIWRQITVREYYAVVDLLTSCKSRECITQNRMVLSVGSKWGGAGAEDKTMTILLMGICLFCSISKPDPTYAFNIPSS